MSFFFGGSSGVTREEMERIQDLAQQMQRGAGRGARNVGEGLHAIGQAILYRILTERANRAQMDFNKAGDDVDMIGGTQTPQAQLAAALRGMTGGK